MTEAEWRECYDPLDLLEAVPESVPDERLWQYVLHSLRGVEADQAAAVLELRLAGKLNDEEFVAARDEFGRWSNLRAGGGYSLGHRPVHIPAAAQRSRAAAAALQTDAHTAATAITRETRHLLQRDQCAWLKCLFANPFCAVAFDPAWLTPTVLTLARSIRESRDFGAMPILADAIQDAGCDNEDVLDHCRGPGPHVRGCWVVDLVLGKE
jgi:hypothetical protein